MDLHLETVKFRCCAVINGERCCCLSLDCYQDVSGKYITFCHTHINLLRESDKFYTCHDSYVIRDIPIGAEAIKHVFERFVPFPDNEQGVVSIRDENIVTEKIHIDIECIKIDTLYDQENNLTFEKYQGNYTYNGIIYAMAHITIKLPT